MAKEKIAIASDFIKLDQFLKWTGIADSGTEAKLLIETGRVTVNHDVELRRGRKLYPGDKIAVGDRILAIANQKSEGSIE